MKWTYSLKYYGFENIVTCRDLRVTYNGFWIGWLDLLTFYTFHSGLEAIIALPLFPHTLQFTVAHALGFSVFTSRILATDFITVSLSLQITHEGFFSQPNSLLAIILQLSIPKTRLSSVPLFPRSYAFSKDGPTNAFTICIIFSHSLLI
jgi:hypothetical protein